MLRKPSGSASRIALLPMLWAVAWSASLMAYQAPAAGLGQAWPHAVDVGMSPHYHVYLFDRDGIRYIQVNDLNGTVLGAVAVADRVALVLPVGVDAQYVTLHRAGPSAETVYRDGTVRLTATPTDTGVVVLNADTSGTCTHPANCTGQVSGTGKGG
jgi:hypothetical protein